MVAPSVPTSTHIRAPCLSACPGAVFAGSRAGAASLQSTPRPSASVKDWSSVPCHLPFPMSSCPEALSPRSPAVSSGTGWGGVPTVTPRLSVREAEALFPVTCHSLGCLL